MSQHISRAQFVASAVQGTFLGICGYYAVTYLLPTFHDALAFVFSVVWP